mmetsp:Transcript_5410/g.3810  ORF Transcript_5410/g.3810 Transcript_5410/m.3810 type:complete len:93 (+) Transcript_5410:1607-1885(+)
MKKLKLELPKLYAYFDEEDVPFQHIIWQYHLTIYTYKVPVEYSKRILELFVWGMQTDDKDCLLRLLFTMLGHTEQRMLEMDFCTLFSYIKEG